MLMFYVTPQKSAQTLSLLKAYFPLPVSQMQYFCFFKKIALKLSFPFSHSIFEIQKKTRTICIMDPSPI